MNKRSLSRFLAILLTLCILFSLLPALPVFALDEPEPSSVDQVFEQIEALRGSVLKRSGKTTVSDFAAISDEVYELVEDSGTAEENSLTANGSFVSWIDEETGISCCYSPKHEAERIGAAPSVDKEALAVSLSEMQGKLKRGGSPSSENIGLIQPFWDSASSYSDYSFREYSPQYKAQAEALASYTGGALYRYTIGNATPDAIAYTLEHCGMVIFDSHGGTDYENESSGDTTSRANCSYLWLDSGDSSAAFIANADEYLLPADYATHTGTYGEYADYYLSSDGTYMVSGQLLANHMTGTAPNSFLYMAICLGMATDGMEAPLRAKGVEAVYGYSQSVSFSGEVNYMKAITNSLMENMTLGEAVAAAKETVGLYDPGDYSSYYYYYYDTDPAYPIVVSGEDEYPGHGNVDAPQNVNAAWTLKSTNTITASSNDTSLGTVSVSGRAIYASPATDCYIVSAEVTEGEGSCTISGNNIIVHSTQDCTVLVTFAPKPEVTLSFSGIDAAPLTGIADHSVRLPSPVSTYDGYTFLGWTEDCEEKSTDRPEYLKPGSSYTLPYEDTILYALYSYIDHTEPAKPARYVEIFTQDKLSQALETPGSYLIVWDYYKEYNDEVVVFNANTDSPSSDPNYKIIAASADGTIVSNPIIDSYAVWIEEIEDTGTYSLKLMNGLGKYFGNTGGSNGINSKKTAPYPMTIRIAKYSSYSSTEYTLIENAEGDTIRTFCFHLTDSVSKFGFYEGFDGRQVHLYHYEPAIDGTLYYTGSPVKCSHEGAFSAVTTPTCTEDGYIDHLCSLCGYKWTEEGEPKTGHSYVDTVVPPTAADRGYTSHVCSVCGDTYQDNFTDPLGNEYLVSYSVLGNIVSTEAINSFTGKTLPASVAINPEGYTFVGWSESDIPQENTTAKHLTGTYKPSADTTLYAVYRRSAPYIGSGAYEKVTSAPDDWSGDYLIVCEYTGIAFNGSFATTLSNLNKAGNYLAVEIDEDYCIPGSNELDAAAVTFKKVSGTTNYTITTKLGLAIGSTGGSTAGAINAGAANPNTITMNSNKTVSIANVNGSNPYNFTYNSSSTDRFAYWKTSTKTVYPVCLYKKDANGTTYFYTTAPSVQDCEHKQTTTTVTAPTCTEQGYTTYICKNCGESWNGDFVSSLGHDYLYTDSGETHTVGCSRCDYTAEAPHSFENGACVCGKVELHITSANLVLDGKVDVSYAVTVPEDYDEPYMVFTGPNGEQTVTDYETAENGSLIFNYNDVNPQCMGDNISAVLYAKNENGETEEVHKETYSVRQYCVNQLAKDDISEELRTLLSDMLAYGAAAQAFMGYKTDAPVNEGDDIKNAEPSTFPDDLTGLIPSFEGAAAADAYWVSAGLTLTDSVAVNLKFYAEDAENTAITVSLNGRETKFYFRDFKPVEGKENVYTVSFTGIKADEFGDSITASFERNGEPVGNILTYCVNAYVCAMQNNSDEKLAALVKALYCYGASAAAYAG